MVAAPEAAAAVINAFSLPRLNTPRKVVAFPRKLSPRAEFRLLRNQRIDRSPTLAEKFPKLRSLRVTLDFFDSTGATRSGGMKYKVDVNHGKSMLWFNCMNPDCSEGDYDLSAKLAQAVAEKRASVEGQVLCPGSRHNKERKETRPCQSILRYKLCLSW